MHVYIVDIKVYQLMSKISRLQFETFQFSAGNVKLVNIIRIKHKHDSQTRNPNLDLTTRDLSKVCECRFD
jgi:hypothetical protein